jgi:ferrous iron transport protein A
MNTTFSLDKLPVGRCGIVQRLHTVGNIRRRLLDIGLIENTVVECIGKSPAGDPLAFLIRGAVIAIRREDCRTVDISIEEEETLWD